MPKPRKLMANIGATPVIGAAIPCLLRIVIALLNCFIELCIRQVKTENHWTQIYLYIDLETPHA